MDVTGPRPISTVAQAKARGARRLVVAVAVLFALAACKTVQITRDPLLANVTPAQDKVCRAAVRQALLDHGVSPDWVQRVAYNARASTRRGSGDRVTGFEAWIYPKDGQGILVMELNENCQVTRMWAQGTR